MLLRCAQVRNAPENLPFSGWHATTTATHRCNHHQCLDDTCTKLLDGINGLCFISYLCTYGYQLTKTCYCYLLSCHDCAIYAPETIAWLLIAKCNC
uniref:Uncharacterized protein n=1 Tax=Arundo donax TaxID=35708 RepID=A0A0A9A279_ARUDO